MSWDSRRVIHCHRQVKPLVTFWEFLACQLLSVVIVQPPCLWSAVFSVLLLLLFLVLYLCVALRTNDIKAESCRYPSSKSVTYSVEPQEHRRKEHHREISEQKASGCGKVTNVKRHSPQRNFAEAQSNEIFPVSFSKPQAGFSCYNYTHLSTQYLLNEKCCRESW